MCSNMDDWTKVSRWTPEERREHRLKVIEDALHKLTKRFESLKEDVSGEVTNFDCRLTDVESEVRGVKLSTVPIILRTVVKRVEILEQKISIEQKICKPYVYELKAGEWRCSGPEVDGSFAVKIQDRDITKRLAHDGWYRYAWAPATHDLTITITPKVDK